MTSPRDQDSLKDVEYLKRFLSAENKADKQHRTSIVHDKMDRLAMERALQDVDQFKDMEHRLAAKFEDHGSPLTSDIFQALNKPVPTVRDEEEMDPKSLIERETIKEMMKLREFEELKDYTTGDPTGAALAGSTMEPKVTEIMEHLKERQDELDELLEQLQDDESEVSEEDLEKLLEEWGEDLPRIRSGLREAMRDATDEMDQLEGMSRLWGTEPGQLKRMPAEERIRLAKKLRNNTQLARLAELIGAFTSFAFAMQHRKTDQLQTDIYDITTGNNLSRVVPSEFALLRRPETRREFHRKYAERGLTQYRLRGREKVGKGGICCAIDTSGSMNGDRDVFAKAVALTLLRIAQRQERTFFGLLFDTQTHYKQDLTHATPDQILDFATGFSGGGTHFTPPLQDCMTYLNAEHDADGLMKSDIVFITDGYASVDQPFLDRLEEFKQRLGCRIFGVAIGVDETTEPLATICDGRVFPIYKLNSPTDIADIFKSV